MRKQRIRQSGDRLTGPGRIFRQMVAFIVALSALMMTASLGMSAAAQTEPGTGAIEVHVAECEPGYDGGNHFNDCHANGLIGVDVGITGASTDAKTTVDGGSHGVVQFGNIPVGNYQITVASPNNLLNWVSYCSLEGEDTEIPLAPENSSGGSLDLAEGRTVICDFYAIPPAEDGGNDAPPAETETASLAIDPTVCPAGTDPESEFDALGGVCTEPAENVMFTWGDASGTIATVNTDDVQDGQIVFGDITPGTYTIYSDVPLEFADEELYCVADGGQRYEKDFNGNGVTTFTDIATETIECDWFIVPYDLSGDDGADTGDDTGDDTGGDTGDDTGDDTGNETGDDGSDDTDDPDGDRGEETGASLTVHLAACPQEYDGSDYFNDCHGNGIVDQEFFLAGTNVELSAMTTVPQEPGPGIAQFTSLPAGDYELAGGPPGDFGTVELFCTLQPGGEILETSVETTRAYMTLGEGVDVVCDWYYIPDDSQGETPTPTAEPGPERAEILVTFLACEPGQSMTGAAYNDFVELCDTPRDGVTFTLGDPGAAPLRAETGVSGPGAVRFYDLLPADYTLSPSLPNEYANAAVFCQLDGGDIYQKTITNGATTFVDVDGEAIDCSWFATQKSAPDPDPSGPTGSITVREFLCEDDAAKIEDWEQDCHAGSSGGSFTVASGSITLSSVTNSNGVATFSQLPDGFYTLEQNEGVWCKARAERVDSQSRVIVENSQNTDVFIYQCAQVTDLPSTGTGAGISPMDEPAWWQEAAIEQQMLMGAGALGAVVLMGWVATRRRAA